VGGGLPRVRVPRPPRLGGRAITDASGTVLQKTSFDPYGGRRATTWNADLPATGLAALRDWQDSRGSRGFTDHEHLNRTGFVHMNGRVYDPRIGRFVSPDPIVQAPWFSQSYNRYAYVFGSPLSYTDPSGFQSRGDPEGGSNDPGYGGRGGGFGLPNSITCDEIAPAEICTRGIAWWNEWLKSVLSDIEHPDSEVEPAPGATAEPQGALGQQAWAAWGDYGGYVVQAAGVGLIVVDILNTPVSPLPELGIIGAGMIARESVTKGVSSIATPFGRAVQSRSAAAMSARRQVAEGAPLWRVGTTGRSAAGEAQFWSLEHPLTPGFASRMGIPEVNVHNANFIESAVLRPGSPFVTRVAPGVGGNVGGGIEVVVPEGGVMLRYFGLQ
jgi:RHS repeat-associated protein